MVTDAGGDAHPRHARAHERRHEHDLVRLPVDVREQHVLALLRDLRLLVPHDGERVRLRLQRVHVLLIS